MNSAKLTKGLRAAGRRVTRTREAVLNLLERTPHPVSVTEIFENLQKEKVAIDRFGDRLSYRPCLERLGIGGANRSASGGTRPL
jgi:hypothetical protein